MPSKKPAGLSTNTPPTCPQSENPAPAGQRSPPPRASRPETAAPRLKTQAIHELRQAERLRSNPYFGDPWPTRLSPGFPCHCLNVAAHSIADAAIHAATSYYAKLVAIYAKLKGIEPPLIDPWKNDLIRNRILKGKKQAIDEIRVVTGLVVHSNPRAGEQVPDRAATADYSGHVQPWMDALLHRGLIIAAVEAFKEIDERYSANIYEEGKKHLPFFFKVPGTIFSKPFMAKFPCLCKDATANRVADIAMRNAVDSVKNLSEESPASQQYIRKRLEIAIARATVDTLQEIAKPEDKEHTCSSHGPAPHMDLPMTIKVYDRCIEAATKCMQAIDRERAELKTLAKPSDNRAERPVQPRTQQHVIPAIKHQVMPSRQLRALQNPPTLPVSGITLAGNPKSIPKINGPHTLMEHFANRDLGKQIYANKVTLDAIYFTVVSLKDLLPIEEPESAVPEIRAELQSPITMAKNYALDAIARYESIVDEVGNIDSARYLYLQEHGWMNAFLIHAIKKGAERAGKALRKKKENEEIRQVEAVELNEPISQVEAAEIIMNLAIGNMPRTPNSSIGRVTEEDVSSEDVEMIGVSPQS